MRLLNCFFLAGIFATGTAAWAGPNLAIICGDGAGGSPTRPGLVAFDLAPNSHSALFELYGYIKVKGSDTLKHISLSTERGPRRFYAADQVDVSSLDAILTFREKESGAVPELFDISKTTEPVSLGVIRRMVFTNEGATPGTDPFRLGRKGTLTVVFTNGDAFKVEPCSFDGSRGSLEWEKLWSRGN